MTDAVSDLCRTYVPRTARYAFLCGAGVSASPPSNLPIGAEFVTNILACCALEDFLPTLEMYFDNRESMTGHALRFETILQALQDTIDPDLAILDDLLFSNCPNSVHRFLSNAVLEGHAVFTTNFDPLIECGSQQLSPIATED